MNATQQQRDYAQHRAFVGPPEKYDLACAGQFSLLTALGMREHHTLLDIGCGSLRGGKLFIPYLDAGGYFGIEPEQWLVDEGIAGEIGRDLVDLKKPVFSNDADFTLSTFGRRFDWMLAQSIFSHATQEQIRRCLCQAKSTLAPTGIFAATYFVGDSNYDGDEWVYPGLVHYRTEFFAEMVANAGLACMTLNWSHPNNQTWVAIAHPENLAAIPILSDAARIGVLEQQLAAAKQKLAEMKQLKGMKFVRRLNKLLNGNA